MQRTLAVSTVALFFLAFIFAPTSAAQVDQEPPPAPDIDITDEDIEMVAEAYVMVEDVRQEYTAEFQQTEDPEEAQELQMELQEEINAVIEDMEGLTLEEYDQYIQAAQQDAELRDQLLDAIEEHRDDDAAPQEPPRD